MAGVQTSLKYIYLMAIWAFSRLFRIAEGTKWYSKVPLIGNSFAIQLVIVMKKEVLNGISIRPHAGKSLGGSALDQQAPPPLNTAQGVARRIFMSSHIDHVWQ